VFIIGNNLTALNAAKKKAEQLGFDSKIVNDKLVGEARSAGNEIANHIKNFLNIDKPTCFLFGGETTVTVKGNGLGGRNQELVLSALIEMKDIDRKFLLSSVGTDGRDGPTDAAGAFINEQSWKKAIELNLKPEKFLEENNSYNFFDSIGTLIKTGSTGTNVMDIQIALLR
ncbi:MAG TPA: glycerate dehydrogenase, partial [Ignavibacteria bacterium]|nr:glycerate dehydrogenase [Ignavibacteria bacterium]